MFHNVLTNGMFHNVLTDNLIDELIEIALFEVKYFRCEMVPGYQSFNDMHQKYENVKSINDLVTISESLYRITFNKNCEVIRLWFNVLKQDGQPYDWHTHNNTTGVYYLLNTENSGTIIDDYLDVCISQDISLNVSTKDTFKVNSGTIFFKAAQKIVSLAQQKNIKGWNQSDGTRNRFWLVDTLLSNTFREYRTVQYEYHRKGMDFMTTDLKKAKSGVLISIEKFLPLYKRRPNAFLIQTFFDAKSDEIIDIFSEGPEIEIKQTLKTLNKIAPYFGPKWKKIR